MTSTDFAAGRRASDRAEFNHPRRTADLTDVPHWTLENAPYIEETLASGSNLS
jgi:hypothetical protein